MSKFNTLFAAVAATALLSGNAFAASLQPAAGEAPFADVAASSSTLQRAEVRADAARHRPAAGDYSVQAESAVASDVTRAEVRAEVRDALAHGFHIATGERA